MPGTVKFCTECGAKLTPRDKFCTSCGQPCLSLAVKTSVIDKPAAAKVQAQPDPLYEGIKYIDGIGVARDYQKAGNIFQELLRQGNEEAKKWLALVNMYVSLQVFRDSLEKKGLKRQNNISDTAVVQEADENHHLGGVALAAGGLAAGGAALYAQQATASAAEAGTAAAAAPSALGDIGMRGAVVAGAHLINSAGDNISDAAGAVTDNVSEAVDSLKDSIDTDAILDTLSNLFG